MALDGWLASGDPNPQSREAVKKRRAEAAVERSREEVRVARKELLQRRDGRLGVGNDNLYREGAAEREQLVDPRWRWEGAAERTVRKRAAAEPVPVEQVRRAAPALGEDV